MLLRDSTLIWLVKHADSQGTPTHIVRSNEDAAKVVRAFGGDPAYLDDSAPDAQPRPDTL